MNSPLLIRPALPNESDILTDLALRSKASWGYSREMMSVFEADLEILPGNLNDELLWYRVGVIEWQIIGFYVLEQLQNTIQLSALFVDPKFKRQGYGAALLKHAKQSARESGAQSIETLSDPHAKSFYTKAGGVEIGEKESESVPGRFLPLILFSL